MTQYRIRSSKMFMLVIAAAIVLGGFAAQQAFAQTTTRPGLDDSSGQPVFMGMVHINVAAVRKELPALVKQFQPLLPPAIGAKLPALTKMLDKIESIDVFILQAGREPMPVAAVSGKLAPQDVADILSMFVGTKITPSKLSEGRYAIGPLETITVSKRLFVAPAGLLSKDMLTLIAAGEKKFLTGLLAKVDRKAHIWGGAEGMDRWESGPPTSVAGSVSIGKKLSGKVDMVFSETRFAERMEGQIVGASEAMDHMVKAKRDGKSVTLTLNGAPDQFIASLMRARKMARRTISKIRLKGMGMAIEIYAASNDDAPPPSLAKLMEVSKMPAKMLLSPSSGRKTIKTDAKGIPTEPSDYEYIVLPANAPSDLVRMYEDPKINDGQGANVLYADSHVAWVTPEKLKEDLAKTHKWLADNKK